MSCTVLLAGGFDPAAHMSDGVPSLRRQETSRSCTTEPQAPCDDGQSGALQA
jgi:hypothetical protein